MIAASMLVLVAGCSGSTADQPDPEGPHDGPVYWHGPFVLTLPARLSSSVAGHGCRGRAGTSWADVQAGALVTVRDGGGARLGSWSLPAGVRQKAACRFVVRQRSAEGIDIEYSRYTLRVGTHVVAVPPRHLSGNLVINLGNGRQHTTPIGRVGP